MKIHRFPENPLISPADLRPSRPGYTVECVLNPGAFTYQGRIGLVLRVAEKPVTAPDEAVAIWREPGKPDYTELRVKKSDPDLDAHDPRVFVYKGRHYLTTLSHLRTVWSNDGGRTFQLDDAPRLFPETEFESYGIEDCRVTRLEGEYRLTFTAVSAFGVAGGHCATRDWKHFTPRQLILPPHNKDIALFDRKINGKYWMFHRPSGLGLGGNDLWLAESPDSTHWGNHRCVATTRPGWWDSERIGAGAAPIDTPEGLLEIYHGSDGKTYRLGLMLFDRNDPARLLARSAEPIMEPITGVETNGFFGNCIFTNGQVVENDRVLLYYGAADTVVCGAELSLDELLGTLR